MSVIFSVRSNLFPKYFVQSTRAIQKQSYSVLSTASKSILTFSSRPAIRRSLLPPRNFATPTLNLFQNRHCSVGFDMASSQVLDRDILPDTVKPVNYGISIYDIELGGAYSYYGTVDISVRILKSTKEIVLNSHQLKIHSAQVSIESTKTQSSHKSSNISYDVPKQRVTISFPDELPASEKASVVIRFEGTINHDMAGFYRSKYKPPVTPAASVPKDDEYHYMFSTQFESCDARRAFPCFDEPNLKATFDFSIELPEDQVALSNMPEKSAQKGNKPGTQIVSFERTPIMSTYLLAWAVGDFEYVEAFTKRQYGGKHLPVRVYTTKGLKSQASFALEHAHQIVDYFSEVFGIDYPLPKADLLAVHEFSHGAMENWGLVTYRTTAVLYDEQSSDSKYRNRVAYVVAHELAHQWFGNLVTMDWWNELWLNEGFATWVGWLAIDHLHPEWNVWPQFVTESMQGAFDLDALRSSHPIEVPVKDALDVEQIFDAISYLKGSSVIRMLSAHLGVEVFLKGVSSYLKTHSYGNAKTDDLWSALSEASGQDVNALMEPWIRKIGFPVLTVAEEPGQIGIQQSRFLTTGDAKSEEDETTWWVPLGLKGKGGNKETTSIALTEKSETIREVDDEFYKINADNNGFYRTNYPPARLAKLGTQIQHLSIEDKIGLIGDAGALALSGDSKTPGLLAFVEGFSAESNFLVWQQILSSLATVKSVFAEDEAISNGLKAFTLKLISPSVQKIGWEFAPGEDHLTGQLRALLISSAGANGHESVIAEAKKRFAAFGKGDTNAIHPDLRTAIFQIAIREGGSAEYEVVKKDWQTTISVDGKEISLRAMARVQTPELISAYIDFIFAEVATQDMHTGAIVLAANHKARGALWSYIKSNFESIRKVLGGNMVVLDRFLRVSLKKFTDFETEKDIEKFFEGMDNRGYDRSLGIISDSIKGRASYRKRDAAIILEWLSVNGYA